MKKIIFLLLMAVFLTGFMSAGTAHAPPGDVYLGMADDIIMAEYNVQGDVVTQPTVLVQAELHITQPTSIHPALLVYDSFFANRPQSIITLQIPDKIKIDSGRIGANYYLRC
jgi:hypothetical protein